MTGRMSAKLGLFSAEHDRPGSLPKPVAREHAHHTENPGIGRSRPGSSAVWDQIGLSVVPLPP